MKILFFFISGLLPFVAWSQNEQTPQDSEAKAILDRASEKIKTLKTIQADYSLVIDDRVENVKNTTDGHLLIKQTMYKITSVSGDIYFNGKTMWAYVPATNEVTITEPDNLGEDFLSNPASVFTFYNRDFKYRYVRETVVSGTKYHEIDLYPKNLNQPYSRIKILVGLKSGIPEIVSTIGKDGIDYHVYLKNFSFDVPLSDALFNFDATKFKKVEVVDLRGVK